MSTVFSTVETTAARGCCAGVCRGAASVAAAGAGVVVVIGVPGDATVTGAAGVVGLVPAADVAGLAVIGVVKRDGLDAPTRAWSVGVPRSAVEAAAGLRVVD